MRGAVWAVIFAMVFPGVVCAAETAPMGWPDMDGVIAGLTTALMQGGNPESLPKVRTNLETSGQTLQTICDAAVKTATPESKGL